MYNWNQLGVNEITNLYLHGTINTLGDKTSDALIRPPLQQDVNGNKTALVTVMMDAVSFMQTGPGRFANGIMARVVDEFMSGKFAQATGARQVFTLSQAMALTGASDSDRFSLFGACQGTCRLIHEAIGCLLLEPST